MLCRKGIVLNEGTLLGRRLCREWHRPFRLAAAACDDLELRRYRDLIRNMAGFAGRRPVPAAKYLAAKVLR